MAFDGSFFSVAIGRWQSPRHNETQVGGSAITIAMPSWFTCYYNGDGAICDTIAYCNFYRFVATFLHNKNYYNVFIEDYIVIHFGA